MITAAALARALAAARREGGISQAQLDDLLETILDAAQHLGSPDQLGPLPRERADRLLDFHTLIEKETA